MFRLLREMRQSMTESKPLPTREAAQILSLLLSDPDSRKRMGSWMRFLVDNGALDDEELGLWLGQREDILS